MKKNIKTVPDVITALGGTGRIASRYGLKTNAVCNWRIKNKIPERYRLAIYLELKSKGLNPSSDVIGDLPQIIEDINSFTAA